MTVNISKSIAAIALVACAGSLFAQNFPLAAVPQNVVQLSASGAVEVQQDMLSISLNTSKDGTDAATVQNQLKLALDAALQEGKKAMLAGQMDLRTGSFNLSPRYAKDGKLTGWQGTVELVLEGRDFARISSTAGKITTLTVGNVSFSLSREQRQKAELDAQSMAITRFKARAGEIAAGFGFAGYTLREIAVNGNEQGFYPRPRMMAMDARAGAPEAPIPAEAGKATVQVTVSGSVQLK